ncbi:FAD-dependent oxidoreductase [Chitinophaga alhagiae]|uniref:FAD-dependent oxidoreductase n=1 Tax=Chitinophaga alhagiae TaxID=2203219 RepID=A0ABN5LN70_9BACT|nr:FAD-dependent oxidoreductase [Chitinophaga alhagiae]AWO00810.1 FAD-dependent oxidoreductase [Chitinophaga alhagiae]
MKRRNFLGMMAMSTGAALSAPLTGFTSSPAPEAGNATSPAGSLMQADLVVAGAGLGGCAAALAALRNNLTVIMTEETDWIGGQLSQQGVPPDEHSAIETHGATQLYRDFRTAIRQYYMRHYPLNEAAGNRPYLNPGDGAVSRLCHEPRVAVAVLEAMLAAYISAGKLVLLPEHKVKKATVSGNRVQSLQVVNLRSRREYTLAAPYFADATETGELLPLTGTEFVTGAESKADTGELHAQETANPRNQQSFTVCFAMDYVPGENHVIEKPREYNFWSNHVPAVTPAWPGKLLELHYPRPTTLKPTQLGFHPEGIKTGSMLNLWNYRRIINKENFMPGTYKGDITIVNWPQNDYMLGNLVGVSEKEFNRHVERAKQLNLSLLYWLQTEAPRPDGGKGWPGLRLRKDIMGTEDGMAKYPYIRESRRIKAVFTVLEEHVGSLNRAQVTGQATGNTAAAFFDSVGVGHYSIDLHPSSAGNNYFHLDCLRFQIPLGALLPVRMENLLPANKNIGTTHITNGCYRLHPVEWGIGEAVGMLAAFALEKNVLPRRVREDKALLAQFQQRIRSQGIETEWPRQ